MKTERELHLDAHIEKYPDAQQINKEPVFTGVLMWSSLDSEPFGEIEWVSQHLVQLGVALKSFRVVGVFRGLR